MGCPQVKDVTHPILALWKQRWIIYVLAASSSFLRAIQICLWYCQSRSNIWKQFYRRSNRQRRCYSQFSNRGAVTVDNSNRLKPNISAPGVSIKSCITNGGFPSYVAQTYQPHVAGAVALCFPQNPTLEGNVDKIEEVFEQTAYHLYSNICNGVSGVPNNVYGYGRIDVMLPSRYRFYHHTSQSA